MKNVRIVILISLAIVGAVSIVYASYNYITQKITENGSDEIEKVDNYADKEAERRRIWAEEGQRLAAKNSQFLVESIINDKQYTASAMLPVHYIVGGEFLVDGVLMSHDGTGQYLNYSCKVVCNITNDPRNESNWHCNELYVNGRKIK